MTQVHGVVVASSADLDTYVEEAWDERPQEALIFVVD